MVEIQSPLFNKGGFLVYFRIARMIEALRLGVRITYSRSNLPKQLFMEVDAK